MLALFHKALLLKLKIMCTLPLIIRRVTIEIGLLTMCSSEITSRVQDIQPLLSLFTRDIPTKIILLNKIEHDQLEIGAEDLFLYQYPHG